MKATETTEQSRIKENCFRMLAACFYEPEKKLYLEENLFGNLSEGLKQVCPEAAVFAGEMEKQIHNYTEEDLGIEYAKLFVGPFELLAPPYGSVYIDEGGRVMGDSTMKVIEAYQREGLSKNEEFKDLPDHIVVEMEFMSYLLFKEREALEKSDVKSAKDYASRQSDFLNSYIRPWVPQLCSKIKAGTDNGFYSALADCALTYTEKV